MAVGELDTIIQKSFEQIENVRNNYVFSFSPREVGYVTSVSAGVIKISGLPNVGFEELLQFPNGLLGIAYNIDADEIGAILLGEESLLNAGDEVTRTGRVMDVPVGNNLIGRVINPLGESFDGKKTINTKQRYPIERPAPAIMDRQAVSVPMQISLKVIDALIPIGRGQRELILGDRQTGKSQI